MSKRYEKKPVCHPQRPHYAAGQCRPCYRKKFAAPKKREQRRLVRTSVSGWGAR